MIFAYYSWCENEHITKVNGIINSQVNEITKRDFQESESYNIPKTLKRGMPCDLFTLTPFFLHSQHLFFTTLAVATVIMQHVQ